LSRDCPFGPKPSQILGPNRQGGHCPTVRLVSGLAHNQPKPTEFILSPPTNPSLSSVSTTAAASFCHLLHQSMDWLVVSNSDWPHQSRGRAQRFTGGTGVLAPSGIVGLAGELAAWQQPAGGHSSLRRCVVEKARCSPLDGKGQNETLVQR
jgi:hypothetical protein